MNGLVIFLSKGDLVNPSYRDTNLVTKYGFTEGSYVIPNKSAYMDDENRKNVVKVLAPVIRKIKVRNIACVCLFYSLYIQLPISIPPNYLKMISGFPEWWEFLTYNGFNYHMNVTGGLGFFAEERIKFGK